MLAMALMLAVLASGAGTAMADPFGPNPYPKGCVGSAAAPHAMDNNEGESGLADLVIDPPEITPGYFWHALATVECREEDRP